MDIVEQMMTAGYKEYPPSQLDSDGVTRLLQKCYYDNCGKKYYINCREWDWRNYPQTGKEFSYEFDVQFTTSDDKTFNVETVGWSFEKNQWGHTVNTLKDVEEFFERLWQSMGCQYNEKYNS